jgi:serine/threonine-protein kinase
MLVTAAELTEGMVLKGKYEVLEKVGVGGMATVYRVRHLHLQEDVAIKVVSSSLAADPDFLERFQTEAVVTRKLRHLNAVRLDDFDVTDDGRPFIVMEFVRGKSLRTLLKEGWLSPARAADIARQVALALGAAHELGIIHRDIKPDNILLVPQADGNNLVKVLDFGIARVSGELATVAANHTPTRTGIILGTPQYVSPEQAKGGRSADMDGRSDLYSLGVVLYEMLTGGQPYHAENPLDLLLQHIQAVPTPPHLANSCARISLAMSELVMKALEKDPAKRFQTAAEMAQALNDPAVREEVQAAEGGAHAFSTAALAAAAAAVNQASERATIVAPASATMAVAGATQRIPRTAELEPIVALSDTPSTATRKPIWRRPSAIAIAALLLVIGGFLVLRPHETAPPVVEVKLPAAVQLPSAAVRPVRSTPRTPRARPSSNATPVPDGVRSQELTALGYRHLQQRDYESARDEFTEALELDSKNAAAKRGLQLAQGAQTVDTISGILRH